MPTMLATTATRDGAQQAMSQPYSEAPPPQWRATPGGGNGSGSSDNSLMPADAMSGARALDALVLAQGQPAVAAERLGMQDADTLLAAIVLDDTLQDRLRSVMRSFAMLRLLGVAEQMEDILMERIDQLDTPSVAKLFAQILALTEQMTRGAMGSGAAQTDPREALFKSLPANVRQALRVVQGDATDASIFDNKSDEQAS